jgi:ubiquitin C-terminal hydrolase
MRGGHYIAYVRGPCQENSADKDSWYYISDSSVRKATLEAVLNSEAYLLFYEKCKINGDLKTQ